jgi:hypothetical protein
MPNRIRKVDDTYADQAVVRKLFQAARKRDRLILRIFASCGLRPQETFALRANDIEIGRLRVDKALKQAEGGAAFIGEPKTMDSCGYVSRGWNRSCVHGFAKKISHPKACCSPRAEVTDQFGRTTTSSAIYRGWRGLLA